MESRDKNLWLKAMEEEMATIKERNVWTLVDRPENVKVLGCRWVYSIKEVENGRPRRYKARLVAQGFNQEKGLMYQETYSPVVNFTIIRLLFSILVTKMNWTHKQIDIKNAYLYAPLKEPNYMFQPPGFTDKEQPNKVCHLLKALYGLHQSGRQWNIEITTTLKELGFQQLKWCNCVFHKNGKIVLLLYVDDIVLFGENEIDVKKCIQMLKNHFEIKSLGRTRKLLGVEFKEEEGSIYLSQENYIKEIYERFSQYNPPILSLPIAKHFIYSKVQCPVTEEEITDMSKYPYRNLVGCLSFLAERTRPDLSLIHISEPTRRS